MIFCKLFFPNFIPSLKHHKIYSFSDVFKGYKKGTLRRNRFNSFILEVKFKHAHPLHSPSLLRFSSLNSNLIQHMLLSVSVNAYYSVLIQPMFQIQFTGLIFSCSTCIGVELDGKVQLHHSTINIAGSISSKSEHSIHLCKGCLVGTHQKKLYYVFSGPNQENQRSV